MMQTQIVRYFIVLSSIVLGCTLLFSEASALSQVRTSPQSLNYSTSRYPQDPYRLIDRGIYIKRTNNGSTYYQPSPNTPNYTPIYIPNSNNIGGISSVSLLENGGNPYVSYGFTLPLSFSEEYDMYDFAFQNNTSNSQPVSSIFLPVSVVTEVYSQNNTKISTSFGAESNVSRVLAIRNIAEGASRVSKSSIVISASTTLYHYLGYSSLPSTSGLTYTNYRLFVAKNNSEAFIIEHTQQTNARNTSNPGTTGVLGLDIASFVYGNSGYVTHKYRTPVASKRYKEYLFTPYNGMNVSTLLSNLDISNNTTAYQTMTSPSYTIASGSFVTTINGYSVKTSSIANLQNFFYYPNPSVVSLGDRAFNFTPLSDANFAGAKLSDSSYRQYRLLVAEDGSDAYLTEYIQR